MSVFHEKKKLFVCSAFNGVSQRLWGNLANPRQDRVMVGLRAKTIHAFRPDVIIFPFFTQYIPAEIWETYPCFVVHPGPPDDGGPSSLNWAILEGKTSWGMSIIQAQKDWDAGPLWATQSFSLPSAPVAHIYRTLVSDSVLMTVPQAIERYYSGQAPLPKPLMVYHHRIRQKHLRFHWTETTDGILKKIHAGDSQPGTKGMINNRLFRLYGASKGELKGDPGTILDTQHGQVCIGTGDGSLWIARLAGDNGIKLRASDILERE